MQADEESLLHETTAPATALTEQDALRCIPGVRAILLRMTRNPDTTNDLAQEVLLAVILAIRAGRIREQAALVAYMHQTARNIVLMQARRTTPVLMDELPDTQNLWGERPRTPLEVCETQEIARLARRVLDDLPTQRDRDLVTGFYVEGKTKPELMALLGLGKDQFDRVMSRARGRMRDLLDARMNATEAGTGGAAMPGIPSSKNTSGTR